MNAESKVTRTHLARAASLYIRQSSLRQVLENTESTQRQYALKRRAVTLGWPEDQIIVIDHDQGQSGASAADREGFQRLVADVGLAKAGIVMGLEVSRLARNCADWHRLLEICALTGTLILDEDGLYDPGHFNDRLLLGLKGAMSEAELHVLKARLQGGVLNKAQRGELKVPLPIGFVYDQDQKVMMDPDQQVQQTLRHFFATFRRTGSAWATLQAFHSEALSFPKRGQAGSGEIAWQPLTYRNTLETLHNPRYAGAFCFGRSRNWKDAEGQWHCQHLPREQWRFLKTDIHPGYLTWDEFLANEQRLLDNQPGDRRRPGPAREGPALLQGLVLCGRCGRGMTVCYHHRGDRLVPQYVCQKEGIEKHQRFCQRIPGGDIDTEVGRLLVESVSPLALEVVLQVEAEIQARTKEADRLRQQQVQRAQYESDQARLRYMRVDPNNRLVADTLETQWNEKLRLLAQAKEDYEKQRKADLAQITAEQKDKVLALASDFPRLWNDPQTQDRDRKRMARLLLADVTLRRDEKLIVQLRFKGGATRELRLPLPRKAWELKRTKPEIVAEIDRLLDDYTEDEIARRFNDQQWRSTLGNPFTARIVGNLRRSHRLRKRAERLRAKGLVTAREAAELLDTKPNLVDYWRERNLLCGARVNEKNQYMYERPQSAAIQEIKRRRQQITEV